MTTATTRRSGQSYPHVIEIVRKNHRQGGVLLELGCGSNQYAQFFAGRHIGSDLPAISYAGRSPDVFCSALALPFRAGAVDTVYMIAVLYHIANVDQVLRECARVLRPGGALIIFDYNRATTARLKRADSGHQIWGPRLLAQYVRRANLTPRVIWKYDIATPASWKRRLLDLRIVRYVRAYWPFNEGWNIVVGMKGGAA